MSYYSFIEHGLLLDLTVGVLISASRMISMAQTNFMIIFSQKPLTK